MITRSTILELIEQAQNPSVSIFLPTHERGEEVQQDPIRLKNQLKEAEQQLVSLDMGERDIKELLKPARDLLDRPLFWQHGDRGLAIFLTESGSRHFRVPLDVPEQVYAGSRFMVTPLLPMIALDGSFCVLGISQKKIRLLRATRDKVRTIALEEAPTSMEEFKKYDLEEKSLSSASGRGGQKSMFHGWGDASVESHYVENYLKQVENEVTTQMRQRNDPLVLAGVKEAVALYRKVNHYSRVMDRALENNPDPWSDEDLRDRAWKIIREYFLQDMYNDLSRYNDLKGSDRQSDNLGRIVESSHYGKVDTLFIAKGEQSWGRFDSGRDVVHRAEGPGDGVYDLINESAIQTLTQGGDVYALDRGEMPDGASVAAIYRYG
ncbi:MAG: hypothetical protein U5K31_08385 [Balneolaceae bacterium]|nr:hypothetical protein [Balneolaceae bacterium]